MRSKRSLFADLGLDPQYLRGIPDELVAQLVKAAFRILIMYYHDDHRTFSNDLTGETEKKKFDEKREKVMTAHEFLSSPVHRREAFLEEQGSTLGKLKRELEEVKTTLNEALLTDQRRKLDFLLDWVGALKRAKMAVPVNCLQGGSILVYNASIGNSLRMFEFVLGRDAKVTSLTECRRVEASKFSRPQNQKWLLEGTQRTPDSYAVLWKKLPMKKKFTVIGTVDDPVFKVIAGGKYRVLPPVTSEILSSTDQGIPFVKLHWSEMLPHVHALRPTISWTEAMVFVDEEGVFYFPGIVRKFLRADQDRVERRNE